MLEYDRLTIRIDPAPDGTYDVHAEGSGGDGHERFAFPFGERELESFVLSMSRGRHARRRVETPETERAREFGGRLFEALFAGGVRDVYRASLAEARRAERGLRITLQLTQVPELMDVPWEYLYDTPSFLSISAWTPVVRYLDLPRPRAPLAVKPPLRILGMVSSPADCEPLDVEEERARLERSLAPVIKDGRVELEWTEQASLNGLLRRLQRGSYHVFHYIGHGAYDAIAQDGAVLLEDRAGGSEEVSGRRLGTILCEHRPLRLAVLNACEGARSSRTDPFAGVAASLVERELPAVIAMQFEITDDAALVFSEHFYDALTLGSPVDTALAHARQGVYADGNDIEWATPVLFLRVPDGRLFDLDRPSQGRRDPEPARVEVTALTAFLAPCLGFLLSNEEAAAEQASNTLGEQVWEHARRLWTHLGAAVEDKPAAEEAVGDVAERPDDETARSALIWQLRKLLAADPALAADVGRLWTDAQRSGVVAAGERSVAVGGNITGSTIVTGDENTLRGGP